MRQSPEIPAEPEEPSPQAAELRRAIQRAGVSPLDADLEFVVERERLRPPTALPPRLIEPAVTHAAPGRVRHRPGP